VSGCDRHREALVEIARGQRDDAGARRHAAACGDCAQRLFDEQALTAALRGLAEEGPREAAPALEMRLRAAVRERAPRRPGRAFPPRWLLVAMAAAVLLATGLILHLDRQRGPSPPPALITDGDEPAEFAPLVYGEPLDGADALHLTRVRVPRSALASFGWRGPVEDGPPVEAEVLVGQDGVARGIRFVSDDGGFRH
jgi:hypothetical protein